MELVPSSKLFTFQQEGCHFSRSVTVTENHLERFDKWQIMIVLKNTIPSAQVFQEN